MFLPSPGNFVSEPSPGQETFRFKLKCLRQCERCALISMPCLHTVRINRAYLPILLNGSRNVQIHTKVFFSFLTVGGESIQLQSKQQPPKNIYAHD